MAATPSDFTLANQLLILGAGRRPSWREITDTEGPPSLASDGVATGEALVAMLAVYPRENSAYRTTYAVVDTLDLTADYTLTIGGFDVVAEGPFSDLADLLATMQAAIQADTDANALVVVTVTEDDELKLVGRDADDYSLDGSATGTGEWALSGDATGALVRLHGIPYDTTGLIADRWGTFSDGDIDVPATGLVVPRAVAGFAQLYVELVTTDIHDDDSADLVASVAVLLGPCPTE